MFALIIPFGDIMNSILCYMMLVALVIRPNRAALIYAATAVGFNLAWSDAEPHEYFATAVLADLICMLAMSVFVITRKVLYMMGVCIASIVINLLGFVMWHTYQSPEWYVWSFGVLYTVAICIILKRDDSHVGGRDTRLHFYRITDNSDVDTSRRNFIKGDTTI